MKTIELYSMPFGDKSNVYFTLLHSALAAEGLHVRPIPGSLSRLALSRGAADSRILAIHWSTVLYGSAYAVKSLWLLWVNVCSILILKARGVKVVWIMHNAYAHDYSHPWIDRWGRVLVSRLADAIVAQQSTTQVRLAGLFPDKKVVYIPHGNYVGAYGPPADRTAARNRFGFGENDIVLLSLGMVRPYKRIEKIVEALTTKNTGIKLWVAGTAEPAYAGALRKVLERPGMRFDCAFVEDSDIPAYFAAADYSIFYYDDSELTSGGMILSLSYGLPVITRDIAASEIVVPGKSGFVFQNDEELRSILDGLAARHSGEREDIISTVTPYDWKKVAQMYVALYTELS